VETIKEIEKEYIQPPKADFRVGDTVRVEFKIIEGEKERVQPFEGVVIARRHDGSRETFSVRRIASGVGVERTFPLNSPRIVNINITRRGKVRRAKLYYLRRKVGKSAKIREGIQTQGKTKIPGEGDESLSEVRKPKGKASEVK